VLFENIVGILRGVFQNLILLAEQIPMNTDLD